MHEFREVNFSRKPYFSFAQLLFVVIEDVNTYLDLFVKFKGFDCCESDH